MESADQYTEVWTQDSPDGQLSHEGGDRSQFTAVATQQQSDRLTAGNNIRDNRDYTGKELTAQDVQQIADEADKMDSKDCAIRLWYVAEQYREILKPLEDKDNVEIVYQRESDTAMNDAVAAHTSTADDAAAQYESQN